MDLLSCYDSSDEQDQDQSETKGQIVIVREPLPAYFERETPHLPGHWASHVHIPVSLEPEYTAIIRKLEHFGVSGDLIPQNDLHISLSRVVYLPTAVLERVRQRLIESLLTFPTRVLTIDTRTIRTFRNDTKTRTFLSYPVKPTSTLLPLIQAIDKVWTAYHQPTYYDPPEFHVSVASFKGECPTLPESFALLSGRTLGMRVSNIILSFGNQQHHIELGNVT